MTDITQRLRTRNGNATGFGLGAVCDEAADEIERLRDALCTLCNRIELEGATPLDWPAFRAARAALGEP